MLLQPGKIYSKDHNHLGSVNDYLVRCITDEFNVIGLACITTDLVDEAARIHGTSRTASAALGRALTGTLLMGALMKAGQRVGLKFEGNGPLRKIIVEADSEGSVRGFVGVPDAEASVPCPIEPGELSSETLQNGLLSKKLLTTCRGSNIK